MYGTYGCVKNCCYLGDTLDGDSGADLAATARIGNGWIQFRELFPFLTSRAPLLEMKGRGRGFHRSQPTRDGTVWQPHMPANRDQQLS